MENCSSNWSISRGSLDSSVTFESPSPIIDHSPPPLPPPPPLLLLTSPPDNPDPCQITLCFKQKYEIRQIYVRSTARVYEIYYSPTWQAADEYLCTVRCSTAERDGDVLQTTAAGIVEDEATISVGELSNSRSPTETNGSSENDWVEVKNPIASYDSAGCCLSTKDDFNLGNNTQDLYEATAEINDADPCTSITIRLLSLQNKCRVFVDEVYVFADLVDPSDSENHAVQMGSSTGNALMAMLVPTLMQFSKSSSNQIHDKTTSDKLTTNAEVVSKLIAQTEAPEGNEQDKKLRAEQQYMMYDTRVEPIPPLLPSHYPAVDQHAPPVANAFLHSRIEGLLEQLVSRVSRVEDYFSRFEENILKPISSIDARLSQVEQKLDILVNNSETFELQRGTKFSAPSFSSGESSSSSIFNDTSRDTPQISELKEGDTHSTDSCKQSNRSPAPESNPQILPAFRITAPEFTCSEGDEDDTSRDTPQISELKEDDTRSTGSRKQSNRSPAPESNPQILPAFRITAPEFTCSEGDEDDTSRDTPQISELKEDATRSTGSRKQGNRSPAPESNPQILPAFRITAPEFTCSEGDEDDSICTLEHADALIPSGGNSLENPKQTVSVDDALAKALSGFLAMSSRSKSEDEGTQVSVANSEASVEALQSTSFDLNTTEVEGDEEFIDCKQSDSASHYMNKEGSTGNTLSSEFDEPGTPRAPLDASLFTDGETIPTDVSGRISNKESMRANSVVVDEQFLLQQKQTNRLSISDPDACVDGISKVLTEDDVDQVSKISSLAEVDNSMLSSQSVTTDESNTPENAAGSVGCIGSEVADQNVLLNLTELSVSPVVDLEFPILEVKFDSYGSSLTEGPLEFLYDVPILFQNGSLDEVTVVQEAEFTSEDVSRVDDLPSDLSFDDLDELSNSVSGLHDPSTSTNHETLSSPMKHGYSSEVAAPVSGTAEGRGRHGDGAETSPHGFESGDGYGDVSSPNWDVSDI